MVEYLVLAAAVLLVVLAIMRWGQSVAWWWHVMAQYKFPSAQDVLQVPETMAGLWIRAVTLLVLASIGFWGAMALSIAEWVQVVLFLISIWVGTVGSVYAVTAVRNTAYIVARVRQFRRFFKLPLPLTEKERDRLQPAVDRNLAARALILHTAYEHERRELHAEAVMPDGIGMSFELRVQWGPVKQEVRSLFYRPRDVASSVFLPFPFAVRELYRDYLPVARQNRHAG